ncbi:uncharacterized protein K460DRAFT_61019 [Cucurbitaria berberidis CBS 394.84]|uniref:Uncharacterized protein n=1 Tax=Cucurbitaria berberidis CBS 394.84 TaxID=1168544 RepID=A0A9P4L9T0_9PLEO|nr:uncharacterized protein K460DRAFT_61019 [Cucurbitaria berberidis CBS 394.84]KAF1847581.1 hypothetical protein K460DRAFT_61019 [Cucurbitaria berberidis CBS 394.84]
MHADNEQQPDIFLQDLPRSQTPSTNTHSTYSPSIPHIPCLCMALAPYGSPPALPAFSFSTRKRASCPVTQSQRSGNRILAPNQGRPSRCRNVSVFHTPLVLFPDGVAFGSLGPVLGLGGGEDGELGPGVVVALGMCGMRGRDGMGWDGIGWCEMQLDFSYGVYELGVCRASSRLRVRNESICAINRICVAS